MFLAAEISETNQWVQLLVAFLTVLSGWMAWMARVSAEKAHTAIEASKVDIHRIEVATNSMKDALVAATAASHYAAGHEVARLEGIATAERLATVKLAEENKKPN